MLHCMSQEVADRYPRRLSGFGALRTTWQASFKGKAPEGMAL